MIGHELTESRGKSLPEMAHEISVKTIGFWRKRPSLVIRKISIRLQKRSGLQFGPKKGFFRTQERCARRFLSSDLPTTIESMIQVLLGIYSHNPLLLVCNDSPLIFLIIAHDIMSPVNFDSNLSMCLLHLIFALNIHLYSFIYFLSFFV